MMLKLNDDNLMQNCNAVVNAMKWKCNSSIVTFIRGSFDLQRFDSQWKDETPVN